MPQPSEFENEKDWMGACVPRMMDEGRDNDQAVAACMSMWREHMDGKADTSTLMDATRISQAISVKAVGDWELDVLAIPFGSQDSDQQHFDDGTDIMAEQFNTPLVVYQHGVAQGAKAYQNKPIIIGRVQPGSLTKQPDGWHIRVILDRASKWARNVWEAAKAGLAAVSSGSISHLARLEVSGKLIPYEKNRPGRIAVWPFAEISLWERGNGNMAPANRFAVALPAMKAIYRDAGIPFPDIRDSHDVLPEADKSAAKRTRIADIRRDARLIVKKTDRFYKE